MTISIENLNLFTRENSIRQLFEPYGQIKALQILKDGGLKISKGVGFICMATREAGLKAIEQLNGKLLDGKIISLRETSKHY